MWFIKAFHITFVVFINSTLLKGSSSLRTIDYHQQIAYSPRLHVEYCFTPFNKAGICMFVHECRHLIESQGRSKTSCNNGADRVCCPMMQDEIISSSTVETTTDVATTKKTFEITKQPEISNGSSKIGIFPNRCGQSSVAFKRIVGGEESVVGAWPWMAVIYYVRGNGKSAECGGTLITTRHVVTAGHCVVSSRRGTLMRTRQLLVRLGDHDLDSDEDGANPIDVTVRAIIKNKKFNARTFQNDIAILLLTSDVSFGRLIAPICIPFRKFQDGNLSKKNAFAAGWGTISYGGPASPKLQQVQVRIWENVNCENVFKRQVPITEANLCAGDGDKDACRGDSGGPLMLASPDGTFFLVGIVSFGKKCAEPGVPGVYTRISHFLNWIEQQVENTFL